MDKSQAPSSMPVAAIESPVGGLTRQTVDLLVCLCIGILVFRTFAAEAYVVPTGSMAPTLLGHHREVTCSNCRIRFVVGIDEQGESGQSLCPNCGQGPVSGESSINCSGDRVLVQKFLYEFRRPKRWEVAVFHFPTEPTQAYVKRVVGLPGESIRILNGDIYVDGTIARKSFDDIRAMRILVHDSRFIPDDSYRYPRWEYRRTFGRRDLPSGWGQEDGKFVHRAPEGDPITVYDWLTYRHWEPTRNRYAPIHDFYAYNGAELQADHPISDLTMEARIDPGPDVQSIAVSLRAGRDRFLIRIPADAEGNVRVDRNDRKVAIRPIKRSGPLARKDGKPALLEASVVDRRVQVAIDGKLLFEPYDYEVPLSAMEIESASSSDEGRKTQEGLPAASSAANVSPLSIGVRGGAMAITDLKIYRDVYYTPSLAQTPRHAFGVLKPYALGEEEYFVLGDNSPVSNDSRFWALSPVVRRSMFLGKPFLVHLPGQVVPLEVFGRSVYWVPDPRKIRYIR